MNSMSVSHARRHFAWLALCACAAAWWGSSSTAEERRIDTAPPSASEAAGRQDAAADSTTMADEAPEADGSRGADTPPAPATDGRTGQVRRRKAELEEILQFAQNTLKRIREDVHDYSCLLAKRERVDGKDRGWQFLEVKIRHEQKEGEQVVVPFSVYLRFLQPKSVAGREVLYVENLNNGDLIARRGGRRSPNVTVQLVPTSPLAMEGNRYPITEIGFETLVERLIEVLAQEMEYRDGEIEVFENARVDDRTCTHYRLTHPKRRENLTYYMAEVSVDNELGLPIFYRAYDFPAEEGGKPILLEQYVYQKLKVNEGLTDSDFDPRNPSYHFQLRDNLEEKVTTKD